MQLVLLIILVGTKFVFAETPAELGRFRWQKLTICWLGRPALLEMISLHYDDYKYVSS